MNTKPLIWTNEKPTAPGFYFWRQPGHDADKDKEIIQLWSDGDVWKLNDDTEWKIDWLSGQFAGPIPEPVEKTKLLVERDGKLVEVKPVQEYSGGGLSQNEWADLAEAMTIQFIASELADIMVPFVDGKARAERLRDGGSQDWHRTFHAMGGALIALEKLGYSVRKNQP